MAVATAVALLVLGGQNASPALASGKPRPALDPAAGRTAPGGLPPFFIDSVLTGDGPWIYQVRDTATGRLTGVDNKLYVKTTATAALASDRTYLVAITAPADCLTRFYLLPISAAGQPGTLRPQPVPAVAGIVWSLAATPDGKTIAYAASGCAKGSRGFLAVTSVATGQTRRWSGVNLGGVSAGNLALAGNLSLSANGRVLGFAAATGQFLLHWSVRVLRTSAPAGPAATRSQIIARLPVDRSGASAAISSSGQTLYTCQGTGTTRAQTVHLATYSVTTGKLLRNLGTLNGPGAPQGDLAEQTCVLSRDASGQYLLLAYGITYAGPYGDTPTLRLARLDLATSKITRFTITLPSAAQVPQMLPTGANIAW